MESHASSAPVQDREVFSKMFMPALRAELALLTAPISDIKEALIARILEWRHKQHEPMAEASADGPPAPTLIICPLSVISDAADVDAVFFLL